MAGNFSEEPIDGPERLPVGLDPFTTPIFYGTPLEPIGCGLLLSPGCLLELDPGVFLELQ